MDRLDAMEAFVAAVEAGSLTAGARKLGTPLATFSRRISDLEAHLGAQLLVRGSRRLSLTERGRNYLAACRPVLESVAEAERAVAGEYAAPRGALTVTAPVVFGGMHVAPVAIEFLQAFPDIDLRLMLSDATLSLQDEGIDVAIRIGALPDSALVASKLGVIRTICCASPEYLAAHGPLNSPQDLQGHACVTFDALSPADVWTFSGRRREVVKVRSRLRVNSAEAALAAAVAGAGIVRVLSYQAARHLRAGTLAPVLQGFDGPSIPVQLLHVGERLSPQKVRAFLDFARPRLQARLGEA